MSKEPIKPGTFVELTYDFYDIHRGTKIQVASKGDRVTIDKHIEGDNYFIYINGNQMRLLEGHHFKRIQGEDECQNPS